jgi:hypothetical protein
VIGIERMYLAVSPTDNGQTVPGVSHEHPILRSSGNSYSTRTPNAVP